MDDAELAARQLASQFAGYPSLTPGSGGGRVVRLAGGAVQATIAPMCPGRSVLNAVTYLDGAALRASIDELAALYDDAGVLAWTVWVRPGDAETARALAAAGHALDGTPELMAAELSAMDLEPRAALTLSDAPSWADVASLNDRAYGLEAQSGFAPALGLLGDDGVDRFVATDGGRPVACVNTFVHDGDCWIILVATLPEARGRGLATELMRSALRAARERGATTTSLEGSAMGRSVYERIGYRPLGALQMWERRRTA